jgi:transposase
MRPKGTKRELEIRRNLAVRLRKSGMTIREVADEIGCAPGSVARWEKMFDEGGASGLVAIPNRGGIARLKPKQRESLERMLIEGPQVYGHRDGVWTLRRIRDLIAKHFRVRYEISNVHRLMHEMGFSPQKPSVRARERNEEAIENFRNREWQKVKKTPRNRAVRSR